MKADKTVSPMVLMMVVMKGDSMVLRMVATMVAKMVEWLVHQLVKYSDVS